MKLKSFENEALDLVLQIWNDDVVSGRFYLFPNPFSDESMSPSGMVDENKYTSEALKEYKVKDLRSIFLLKKLNLIKKLLPSYLFIKEVNTEPIEDDYSNQIEGEIVYELDYEQYRNYVEYKKLKTLSPEEEISYSYSFEVSEKLRGLLNPNEIKSEILKARGLNVPNLVVEYESIKVFDSGDIFYSEEKIKNLNTKSQQYILLINILMNDKNFLTFDELKRFFKKCDIDLREQEDLQFTYENLNKILRSNTPYVIRKVDNGYHFALDQSKIIKQ